MSDHFMHAFCTGELCSGRVSIKLLPYYTFLENILVEGKVKNKHPPVNERKSSYTHIPTTKNIHFYAPEGASGGILEAY